MKMTVIKKNGEKLVLVLYSQTIETRTYVNVLWTVMKVMEVGVVFFFHLEHLN